MEDKDKLTIGLLCHIGKALRGKHGCKKCPYLEEGTGKCHEKLALDALSFIFAVENNKHLLDGMADISEIPIGCRPPDRALEDIRNGKGLEPIKRPPPLR